MAVVSGCVAKGSDTSVVSRAKIKAPRVEAENPRLHGVPRLRSPDKGVQDEDGRRRAGSRVRVLCSFEGIGEETV
jgi:hypothetical protein